MLPRYWFPKYDIFSVTSTKVILGDFYLLIINWYAWTWLFSSWYDPSKLIAFPINLSMIFSFRYCWNNLSFTSYLLISIVLAYAFTFFIFINSSKCEGDVTYRPFIELNSVDDLLPVSFAVIGHCIGIWRSGANELSTTMLFPAARAKIIQTEKITSRAVTLIL